MNGSRRRSAGALPFAMPEKSPPAPKEQLLAFFADLERELERIEFFRPHEKRGTMIVNMRNIFTRMQPSQQDIRTLHGVMMALVEGRKGPARGGLLDGAEADMLRNLLAAAWKGGSRQVGFAGARTGAAAAPQSHRCRARLVDDDDRRPALRGARLQAPDPDRPACRGLRLVSASDRDRCDAGYRRRNGRRDAPPEACLAARAQLPGRSMSAPPRSCKDAHAVLERIFAMLPGEPSSRTDGTISAPSTAPRCRRAGTRYRCRSSET